MCHIGRVVYSRLMKGHALVLARASGEPGRALPSGYTAGQRRWAAHAKALRRARAAVLRVPGSTRRDSAASPLPLGVLAGPDVQAARAVLLASRLSSSRRHAVVEQTIAELKSA